MSARYVHTCIRVLDVDRSVEFYGRLGFEHRGGLNFDSAYNVYLGLPGDGDMLELTVNVGRDEPYDLGDGYDHMALVVDDLDGLLAVAGGARDRAGGPPYDPGDRDENRICFITDPTDTGSSDRPRSDPQDPPHPSTT